MYILRFVKKFETGLIADGRQMNQEIKIYNNACRCLQM